MSKELIARLRNTASKGISVWGDLQMEAAKEIEILTAERESYASAMDRMKIALEAAQAEIERLTLDLQTYKQSFAAYKADADQALARLAEIEKLNHELGDKAYQATHRADSLQVTNDTLKRMKAALKTRLDALEVHEDPFAAAGASPVQPSQAVELSDSEVDTRVEAAMGSQYWRWPADWQDLFRKVYRAAITTKAGK